MARSRSGSMSQGAASSHRAGSSDRATVLSRLETLSKGQNIHSGLSNGRTDDSSPADDIASSQGKSASNGISLSRPNSLQSKNMTPRAQESSSTGDTTTLMGQKRSSTRATSSTLPASQLTPKWSAVNGSLRKVASEGRRIGGSNHDSDPADEEEEEEPEEEVEDEAEEEVEAFEDALESLNGSEEEGGEKEAGSSRMSRINSNNSRSSSDPLVLRGQNESDELEDTDRAPIEILDDSSSGSESILRPGRRLKRRQLRNPSVELLDAPDHGKKDKGKGKAKAEPWSNVIMEIPLKPLAKLRTYSYPDKFARFIPDQSTRLSLSYSSGSHLGSGRNNHTTDRESDSPIQWDDFDAEDEDDDEEDSYGDPESDPIALRRSRRHDRKSPTRRIPRTRATRAQERVNKSHAFSRLTTSSISEDSFYGTSAPVRTHMHRNMKPPARSGHRARTDSSEADQKLAKRRKRHGINDHGSASDEESAPERRNSWKVRESEGEEEIDDSASVFEDDQLEESSEEGSDGDESDDDALRRHRAFCEKCARGPAHELLARAVARKKRPGRRRKKHEDEMSDEELANQLEGWLECEKCVISSHWDCLASTQQKDVLLTLAEKEGPPKPGERRRKSVKIDERAGFVCARCTAVAKCFVCHKERLPTDQDREVIKKQDEPEAMEPVAEGAASTSMLNGNTTMEVDVDDDTTAVRNLRDERPTANGDADEAENSPEAEAALMFRCVRCKLACHYLHLKDCSASEVGVDSSLARKASWYQETPRQWTCHQCRDWIWPVDIICAWRPSPADAVEPELDGDDGEPPSYKDALPREYLVKWAGRGFRHVTWIPHAWAIANAPQKLRHFLEKGPALDLVTDETLAARGDDMAQPTISSILAEDDKVKGDQKHSHGAREWKGYGPPPDKNAESSIPTEWCTIDRVLDVMLLPPKKKRKPTKINRSKRILSASATPEPEVEATTLSPRPDGVNPPEEEKMEIDEWEERSGRSLQPEDADEIAGLITWCFVKWDDLQYDQSTWDTPPPVDSPLYPAFKRALKRFLGARLVDLPVLSASEIKQREMAAGSMTKPPETQPSCIVGGTLMPFQLQGFQWLLYKHFKRESCILADDMGLGKTIQIASLLGYLGSSQLQIYPCLVLVPNSTITNWVREFEKWVPHIQVVPYYGEAASRKIISKYELYHKGLQGEAHGLRAHVVLTTYDMITGSEFRVFGGIPRWEVLCVDEGQRLKSDNSLIFNRLKTLNSVHRILLTGTPLNNNLRELFNLLNFLDKETFRHLQDLEARFQDLDEAKVTELHEMIKPYILRRIKADVLKLPPKIEIIVPISLAPLQKNVYKTILERNADLLKAIGEARQRKVQKEARELKMARKTSAEGDPIVVD